MYWCCIKPLKKEQQLVPRDIEIKENVAYSTYPNSSSQPQGEAMYNEIDINY